ncbi:uncharacterized protein B0P05DRAFT_538575 [Gilbertella persicaria]|uniref:uncharacterized protein n=1 Tax=Gilbertella persicaria TaxID=101096 RepID=UPI00222087C4|nr:uncharacterized protein B0P05DRAFT_538575 [Gilbertella persicaria]KAI8081911.1 hypothetical protein B0P05DRAFT_538575 [Gilbertella persicaria]
MHRYHAPQDTSKSKRINKHPIQQIISALPQLAVSFAVLFFASASSDSSLSEHCGILFYIASLAAIAICGVFITLQIKGAEYKNWQQNPTTRKYIQIASLSTVISFFGFNLSLWSLYGLLTPVVVISGFVFTLSMLMIFTAFL